MSYSHNFKSLLKTKLLSEVVFVLFLQGKMQIKFQTKKRHFKPISFLLATKSTKMKADFEKTGLCQLASCWLKIYLFPSGLLPV